MQHHTAPLRGTRARRQVRLDVARWALAPALLAAGAAVLPGLSGAATTSPLISTANVSGLGAVLASGHRTLYVFLHDSAGKSSCTGVCANNWPPLLVSVKQAHHLGHLRGLGTIRHSKSQLQVTFHHHPLYFFSGDHTTGTAMGEGLLNAWFTVRTDGTLVRAASPAAPTPTSPPAPPSSAPASTTPPVGGSPNPAGNGGGSPGPNVANNTGGSNQAPPPTSPPPTSPPPTSPPPTSPPPTTTPPTTTPSGGGVSF